MAFDKYKNGAWMEPESGVKRYESGAWVDCDTAKRYKNGAWEEVWASFKKTYFLEKGVAKNSATAHWNYASAYGFIYANASAAGAQGRPLSFPITDKMLGRTITVETTGLNNNGYIDAIYLTVYNESNKLYTFARSGTVFTLKIPNTIDTSKVYHILCHMSAAGYSAVKNVYVE